MITTFQRGLDAKEALDVGVYSSKLLSEDEQSFLELVAKEYVSDKERYDSTNIFQCKLTTRDIYKYWFKYKEDIIDINLIGYSIYDRMRFRDYMLLKMGIMVLNDLEYEYWIIQSINNLYISEDDYKRYEEEYNELSRKLMDVRYKLQELEAGFATIVSLNDEDKKWLETNIEYYQASRAFRRNFLRKCAILNPNFRDRYNKVFAKEEEKPL